MNRVTPLRRFLLAACATAALAPALLADVVVLKSGEKLEGKILSETATSIRIETPFGTTDVERTRIAKIEKGQTPKDKYTERKATLKAGDVSGRWELALFCRENKLTKEWKKLLDEILAIDPSHDQANREVGRIQYDNKWFTKEQLEKYKDEERKKMEAAGMVLHDGRWMTEAEAMTAKGFVQVDGKWISKEEVERLVAIRDWQATYGTELHIVTSEHFELRTPLPPEDLQEVLDLCESAHAEFVAMAKPDEKELRFMDPAQNVLSRIYIYVHDSPGSVTQFIESGYIKRHYVPLTVLEDQKDADNFSVYFPIPLIVLSEGRHLKSSDSRDLNQAGMALAHLGQILIRRLKRGGGLCGWAEAGMGHWAEGEWNGYATLSIIEYPHYEPYVDKWTPDGWENFPRWKENLSNPAEVSKLPSLSDMMEKPVEELTIAEEAKAWSMVLFLLETRAEKFFDFVRASKTKFHDEMVTNSRAFSDAFAPETIGQIDAAWATWVKTMSKGEPKMKAPSAPLGGKPEGGGRP